MSCLLCLSSENFSVSFTQNLMQLVTDLQQFIEVKGLMWENLPNRYFG